MRQFLMSYLRVACVIIGLGCLLAAANVARVALDWPSPSGKLVAAAVAIVVVFVASGGSLIRLGLRAPWRNRREE